MTLSEELQWRGFVQDTTYSDLSTLDNQTITFYHGFDASADSQTIGNLAAMMIDKVFLRHGHKAIMLAGGSTSLIGDPGGKDKERNLQDEEIIAGNVEAAKKELERILRGHEFVMVNNLDWTRDMPVLTFLRDIGKHYSMTPLVQRDYIAKRMGEGGSGISYTEFSYTLLQGMDYLHLYDTYGCTLQIGGSDQWGNCLSGVDLVRRARGEEVHVITLPLVINQATGVKFGKSEDGAVWLNPERTSPYKFYQFWLNVDDEGVEYYLKVYTELDKQTIDDIVAQHQAAPHERMAQKRLADEVTRLVHGEDQLRIVQDVTNLVFGRAGTNELNDELCNILRREVNYLENITDTSDLAQILVDLQLCGSKKQAREMIAAGAIKNALTNDKIDADTDIPSLATNGHVLIRKGKNSLGMIDVRS
ncbi:MAG: tyrosine--tRNA ligase [Patescibacteria group bacterium]